MRRFFPQGWSFFTRNPREAWRQVYLHQDGAWVRPAQRQMSADQLFGARRQSRRVGAESAWLTEELWSTYAEDCDAPPMSCLASVLVAETIANTYPSPTLCSTVAIVEQKFVPFAWRELPDVVMPSQVLKLEVTCSTH